MLTLSNYFFDAYLVIMNSLNRFKLPLYEQIRLQLQTALTEKKWQIDQPLPSEQELATQYKVSVGTIRKAVEKMVEAGILIKYQGKGTFLKQPDFHASLLRFFRFRDNDGVSKVPLGVVRRLEIVDGTEAINQKLNREANKSLIFIERIRLIEDVVILSEKIWLPSDKFSKLLEVSVRDFGNLLYPFYYDKCAQFVFSATERLEFVKGYRDKNLGNDINDNLVKVCRVANNLQGEPIEYRESFGRADNFVYDIQIN